MERKNRGYTKHPPTRSAGIIIIVAEGKREDKYFKKLREQISNIKVEIIQRENGISSPKYAFERLEEYKQQADWNQLDGDQVWFVFDVDNWGDQLIELIEGCNSRQNHNTAISNPCFEVWLHYHSARSIPPMTARELNETLKDLPLGQYSPAKFVSDIQVAIINARTADTAPDHSLPGPMQTKVYKLAENLLALIRK